MDPNACVADFLYRSRPRTECERDYRAWRQQGGFPATVRLIDAETGYGVLREVADLTAKDRKVHLVGGGRYDADRIAAEDKFHGVGQVQP
jgi:hypothetical protein